MMIFIAELFLPANGWKQIVQSAITVDKEGEEISYWPDMWSLRLS